eukprot:gene16012-21731_t
MNKQGEVYSESRTTIEQDIILKVETLLNEGKANDALTEISDHFNINSVLSSHEQTSNFIRLRINIARCFAQLGRLEDGEQMLIELIGLSNIDIENKLYSIITLGKIYLFQQKWNEAQSFLEKSLNLDPRNHNVYALLGKIFLLRDNDVNKAAQYLGHALELKRDDANNWFEYGMILFHYDNEVQHNEAKQAFQMAEVLNSNLDHTVLGKVYLHYKHVDWAAEQFRKAIEIAEMKGEDVKIEILLFLGECYDILNKPDEAIKLYEQVLMKDKKNAIAHAGIGLLLLGTGNRNYASINACGLNQEEAIKHLRIAADINPSLQPVINAIDFCRLEIKQTREWKEILNKSSFSRNNEKKNKIFTFLKNLFSQIKRIIKPSQKQQKIKEMKKNWLQRELTSSLKRLSSVNVNSWTNFFEDNIIANKPIVIKNFQQNWKLFPQFKTNNSTSCIADMNDAESIKSIDDLMNQFGDSFVRVSVSESGRFDGPENGTLWGISPSIDVLV